MEVISNNIGKPLEFKEPTRRSLVKPPLPPKPQILPKSKRTPVWHDRNSKVIVSSLKSRLSEVPENVNVIQVNCRNNDVSVSGNHQTIITCQEVTAITSPVNLSGSLTPNDTECSTRISRPLELCGKDELESSCYIQGKRTKYADPPSPEDVSSSIMERTLEECVDLSSKSSSNSSLSSDSDSDTFLACETTPTLNNKPPVINLYDPSSSETSKDCPTILLHETVDNSNRERKAFLVAKEIQTSEESFVAILKLLNEDLRAFFVERNCIDFATANGKRSSRTDTISERELDEILKFLPNLQNLNEEILSDFANRIEHWDKNPKIADIIVRKGPFLKLYTNYIKSLEHRTGLLQQCAARYSLFGKCLKEFESSERSHFLPVSKHMLTPMQRITKYKELMRQYLKHLNEDSLDFEDATQALEIVKDVAQHANEAIRELENSARLLCLQERLNGFSPPEGGSVGVSGGVWAGNPRHLLVEPGRRLLKEGQLMKLCRRGIRDVYLILLSDVLLYTTQEVQGGKNCPLKLRYRLPLEGMRVISPVSEDFQTEFSVISTSRSFTVRASCAKERDAWLTSLRNAVESNANRRHSFERAKTSDLEPLSLSAIGKQAPAWIPDNRVTMCQVCTAEFSLTFRRHHCRACGKVVCRHCSSNRAPLAYMGNEPVRVCDVCFDELQKAVDGLAEKEDSIEDEGEREDFKRSLTIIKGRFKKGFGDGKRSRMKKPERLLEVHGGDHAPQICGYLRQYSRTWRQSWFVLKDKVLYEYRAPEDVCALNSLPILGYEVSSEFKDLDIFDGIDHANAFQLLHPNQAPVIFYAESNDLAQKWKAVMEKEVNL